MLDMQENFQYDHQKFKDVVHYVVDFVGRTYGSEFLGNTKLHKVLYFVDILHYLSHFRPLTGAEYQRQKFGPAARHLSSALSQLTLEDRIETKSVNYFGYSKKEYHARKTPILNRLSDEERKIIEHVTAFVCQKAATEISEFNHDDVWASVPMGQRIPYFAALAMFPAVYSEKDIEAAQAEVPELVEAIESGKS